MLLFHKYIFILILSLLASAIPFMASILFDAPHVHGFFSADVFFLILLLLLPQGKVLRKTPFIVSAVIFAVIENSFEAYALAGVYTIIVFVAILVPRQHLFLQLTFVILLLFVFIADWANFFYSTFVLTLSDIWGLAKFFWWGPLLFVAVPLLQILLELMLARKILWGTNRLEISHLAAFIAVVAFVGLNFGISKLQNRILILDFAVKNWMWQLCTPGIIGQNPYLQEDIKSAFPIWDKTSPAVVDFTKPTVIVLVESYGVNKSVAYTDSLLAPFSNSSASFTGLFLRNAAHTQGAEWEDFGMPKGNIRGVPIPKRFKDNNLQTWFLHGYDGSFYNRKETYGMFGFDSLLFKNDLSARGVQSCHYGFEGICDSAIVDFIDSLMTDSFPKFIYWTTLDAHPPYEFISPLQKTTVCNSLKLSDVDCTYFTLQQNTARYLAHLAAKHPEYRFVIRGDHRPMGSLEQSNFVQSFYFRWVPLIIINDT